MNDIYYIIIIVTIVSYLLGLFLSHFEKKGKISILSQMGNAGFVNIYGINKPIPEYDSEETIQMEPVKEKVESKKEVIPVEKDIIKQDNVLEPVTFEDTQIDSVDEVNESEEDVEVVEDAEQETIQEPVTFENNQIDSVDEINESEKEIEVLEYDTKQEIIQEPVVEKNPYFDDELI